jgi:hypothetical protein
MIFQKLAQAILYDEEDRPELYAYFVEGGPGQILDNAHGNVLFALQIVLRVLCIH